ncbi:MAG: Hpt domain-containing protein [Planctomycetota bacterium]
MNRRQAKTSEAPAREPCDQQRIAERVDEYFADACFVSTGNSNSLPDDSPGRYDWIFNVSCGDARLASSLPEKQRGESWHQSIIQKQGQNDFEFSTCEFGARNIEEVSSVEFSDPDKADTTPPQTLSIYKASSYADVDAGDIVSSLELDDAEQLRTVELFIARLHETSREMVRAARQRNHDKLARLIHWLQGSGNASGFAQFSDSARELSTVVESGNDQAIFEKLGEIIAMTRRVRLPSDTSAIESEEREQIHSTLPMQDEGYREIVELFVQRLRDNTKTMLGAARARSYEEIYELAHWLKGSGPCAGFEVLYEPAKKLEQVSQGDDHSKIVESLTDLIGLTKRISPSVPAS